MDKKATSPQYGSDLARYLGKSRSNLEGPIPTCVSVADELVALLANGLDKNEHLTSGRVFQLGFGSWRTAVSCGLAGATSQVPIVLRHAVECALYAYLFTQNKEYEQLWWERETNLDAKKTLRNGRTGALAKAREYLILENSQLSNRVKKTLDHLIDFGAHPNIFQLIQATEDNVDDDPEYYSTMLLGTNESRNDSFIQCCLVANELASIFELAWSRRYHELGGKPKHDEALGQARLFIANRPVSSS